MYKTFDKLDLPAIDQEILAFWETNEIFTKSVSQRPASKPFVFYEGPPSANGLPGIHHVMGRTVKDLFCRYQTMKGYRVERKGGWDTHGLPVELQVEKELGITKEDIGKSISVDDYNKACRETVLRFKHIWDDITRKMGYWVDLDDPYITFKNEYIESVWWLLGQLYNKSLIYKGFTIQPYSPAAGTGLSSHELNLPGCYKEVSDTSIIAMFKVVKDDKSAFLFDSDKEDVRIIAWTTTPWTLPSNVALTVGPNITYSKVKTFNAYTGEKISVILAKARVDAYFPKEHDELPFKDYQKGDKNIPFNVDMANIQGSDLVDVRYEQLMPYVNTPELLEKGFRVIPGDWVTTEDGTGVVHTAPFFGADDYKASVAAGIPFIGVEDEQGVLQPLVDRQGRFVAEVTDFAGKYVKAEYYEDAILQDPSFRPTDVLIAMKLKEENKAFKTEKYKHNYPHCWRTDKPILYYPLDSWFIRASSMKERMAELNRTINWKPESTGVGRFGQWLDNLQDWNLSRSRYWGIPLPIWRTEDGSQTVCIDSIDALQKAVDHANKVLGLHQQVPADLHRPYIDEVILATEDGQEMKRELDLIDVWFDSGAMPYAQWHYPFENKELFEKNFPANFIAEGVDQTRGWFYTLHAIAVMVFDSVAFKNVVSNGLVLDKEGNKMSKRLGNAVDPFDTINQYGADATRWYMIANAPPWDNLKFDESGVDEVRRKLFGTLYNTYSFFSLYANIDNFRYEEGNTVPINDRPEIDRWVLSKLNSLHKEVMEAMDDYEPTKAARAIDAFVDNHLSNWHVRLSRRRFWKSSMSEDKKAAFETLFECLTTLTQLMAPIAPFFADWMYHNLTDSLREMQGYQGRFSSISVHLTDLAEADAQKIDLGLEKRMDYAQRISSLVLSLRKRERLRVRQPLAKIMLPILDPSFQLEVDGVKDLILSEVNVKVIEYIREEDAVLKKKIKPNFKTLGRRLGKDMKEGAAMIQAFDQAMIGQIEASGSFSLTIQGQNYALTAEDVEIMAEDIPGLLVANDGSLTVALDIVLTDSLIAEGIARELVNRIQNLRKSQGLNVTDRIRVRLENLPQVAAAVAEFGAYIQTETLADSLLIEDKLEAEKVDLVDEIMMGIAVDLV